MRRRATAVGEPPAELLSPPPAPYPIPPGTDPRSALLAWRAAYDEWIGERAAWVAAGGVWPDGTGGEIVEAVAVPDEPIAGLGGGST